MSEIKMLPLPDDLVDDLIDYSDRELWCRPTRAAIESAIEVYGLDMARHNVKERDAEIEALRAEVDRRTERVIVHRGQALACSESAHAAFTAEKARAERLAEALRDALEYLKHHLPDDMLEMHRAALDQEGRNG